MTYDFTTILDRAGHDALALDAIGAPGSGYPAPDAGFDPIPMWVADMSFPVAPSITRAIEERLQHPTFGYFSPSDAYHQAIIDWHRDRKGVADLEPRHIGYENGVLGGVVSTLTAFAAPGDAVLVHSPTYVGFTHALEDNGFKIVHSPLVRDAGGVWRMDYEDMERKLTENRIHAAILCSPHNPCGRVWERQELERAMELFRAHDCVVISDEIWSDIVRPGVMHIPTQSVSVDAHERTVALYAPSKTFNLAGLVGSYHVIYNDYLRDRVTSKGSKTHYNSMNVLSQHALVGAYSAEGRAWADELNQVIAGNVDWAYGFIERHLPGVSVFRPQGTYMLFLDCSQWCERHGRSIDELLRAGHRVGVYWQDGRAFNGPCHLRMNLALPLSRVQEAFGRLAGHGSRPALAPVPISHELPARKGALDDASEPLGEAVLVVGNLARVGEELMRARHWATLCELRHLLGDHGNRPGGGSRREVQGLAVRHDAPLERQQGEEHEGGDVVHVRVGGVLHRPDHEEPVAVHVDCAVLAGVDHGEHVAKGVTPGTCDLDLALVEPERVVPNKVVDQPAMTPERV